MATSDTGLVNLALARIGSEEITSLADETPEARLANRNYASIRDAVLRERQWNSASRRASLTLLGTAPTFGYGNAFALPVDFIRLNRTEDLSTEYAIENTADGKVLVTDDDSVNIIYNFQLTDVTKMDEGLKHAIVARLAWWFSYKITGDAALTRTLWSEYQQALADAAHVDAIEAPVEEIMPSSWVEARRIGTESYKTRTRLT